MRTVARLAIATAVVLAGAALLARRVGERGTPAPDAPTARPIRVLPPDSVISGPVDTQITVGAYLIRLVRDTTANDRIVDITQSGHRVFAVRAADARLEFAGRDITGDHIPDVVVQQYSGGIHCCSQATVLSLGATLGNWGTIPGADGDIEFDDLDNDGVFEARVSDFRFAYWREYAFADTQAPEVILRFKDGGYVAACDLMADEAPNQATLNRRGRQLTAGWTEGDPPAEFWGYAVDLIYGGHADIAWRWLDQSWPAGVGGKAEFLQDLREKLRGSPCWNPLEGRSAA